MSDDGAEPDELVPDRKFRIRRQLEEFKRRMLRNAIEQRAGVNSSSGGYIPFVRVSKNGK